MKSQQKSSIKVIQLLRSHRAPSNLCLQLFDIGRPLSRTLKTLTIQNVQNRQKIFKKLHPRCWTGFWIRLLKRQKFCLLLTLTHFRPMSYFHTPWKRFHISIQLWRFLKWFKNTRIFLTCLYILLRGNISKVMTR